MRDASHLIHSQLKTNQANKDHDMKNLSDTARTNRLAALNAVEERKRSGTGSPRNGRPMFVSARMSH